MCSQCFNTDDWVRAGTSVLIQSHSINSRLLFQNTWRRTQGQNRLIRSRLTQKKTAVNGSSSSGGIRHVLLYRLRLELHAEVSDWRSTTSCCVLRRSLVLLPSTPAKASANHCRHPTPGHDFSSHHPAAREHVNNKNYCRF